MSFKPLWILTLFTTTLALAQENLDTLPALQVSTASKTLENQETSTERILVIDQKTIEKTNASNVEDLLRNIPGVVIHHHPMAQVSMQGFSGDYVKVLIDGIEVAGEIGGAVPVNLIPVHHIEQIEIQKGTSSALYGSEAMGGVINIITKKALSKTFEADFEQKLFTTERYVSQGNFGFQKHNLFIRATGFYDHDNGKKATWTNPFDKEVNIYPVAQNTQKRASANLGWQKETSKIMLSGQWNASEKISSGSSGMENRFKDKGYSLHTEGETTVGQNSLLGAFISWKNFHHTTQQTNLSFGNKMPQTSADFHDLEAELKWNLELNEWNSFLGGINSSRNTMESSDFSGKKQNANLDLFLQDIIRIHGEDVLQIVPGLRLANQMPIDEDSYEITPTPKLSIRYAPTENQIYRFSYGMGYKKPSLKQKYWLFFHTAPANFMLLGNPDLEPEKSHGWNASGQWKILPGLSLTVSGYFNYIFNLITTEVTDENEGTAEDLEGNTRHYTHIRTYVNKNQAYTTGGDFSIAYNKRHYDLGASYSYLKAREKTEGQYIDLTDRPKHSVRLHLSREFPQAGTTLATQITWNSKALYDQEKKTYTPDYLMGDISVRQNLGTYVQISGGVQNFLNNYHFSEGNDSENSVNQETYYGLYDGRIYYLNLKILY